MDTKPDVSQLPAFTIPASSPTLNSADPSRHSHSSHDSDNGMEVDVGGYVPAQDAAVHRQPTREVGEDGVEVDARWNDRSAGFSLLSSDNVRFYVPIYHLQSMSVPLRHLVKDKTELKFDSGLIDDADTLLLILHAMTSADLTAAVRFNPFDFCLDLLWASRFAEKYECTQIQSTIKFWLKDYITSTVVAPLDILIIACKTSSHDIAAQAVKRSFTAKETDDSVYSPWGRIEGEGRLDPKKMGKRIWSELSGEYLWALNKVYKKKKGSEDLTGIEAERLFLKHVLS